MLRRENPGALDAQVSVDEFDDLGFSFPPGIRDGGKDILFRNHG
jgi:hypothetical protein